MALSDGPHDDDRTVAFGAKRMRGRVASTVPRSRMTPVAAIGGSRTPHRNLNLGIPFRWSQFPVLTSWLEAEDGRARSWGRQCGDAISSKRLAPARAQGDGGSVRAHRGGRRGVALPANPFRGLAINA